MEPITLSIILASVTGALVPVIKLLFNFLSHKSDTQISIQIGDIKIKIGGDDVPPDKIEKILKALDVDTLSSSSKGGRNE